MKAGDRIGVGLVAIYFALLFSAVPVAFVAIWWRVPFLARFWWVWPYGIAAMWLVFTVIAILDGRRRK
jgi:hypothetical protein